MLRKMYFVSADRFHRDKQPSIYHLSTAEEEEGKKETKTKET